TIQSLRLPFVVLWFSLLFPTSLLPAMWLLSTQKGGDLIGTPQASRGVILTAEATEDSVLHRCSQLSREDSDNSHAGKCFSTLSCVVLSW
ncbi:hypothetical protein STEG23_034926, partial [Scotinomys teguina]